MKTFFRWIAILASTVLLGACATSGERIEIPISMPNGQSATIYTSNETLPTWARATDSYQLSFVTKNAATAEQLAVVAALDRGCKSTQAVHPHMAASIPANGLLYGTIAAPALFCSGAPGVSRSSRTIMGIRIHRVWCIAAASGIVNWVDEYTYQNCAANTLALFQEYAGHAPTVRTRRRAYDGRGTVGSAPVVFYTNDVLLVLSEAPLQR